MLTSCHGDDFRISDPFSTRDQGIRLTKLVNVESAPMSEHHDDIYGDALSDKQIEGRY